jgi:hypothetical protein
MKPKPEFEDLFVEEYPRVVRTVSFVVQDQGRAEEVTQDAFVALLRHWLCSHSNPRSPTDQGRPTRGHRSGDRAAEGRGGSRLGGSPLGGG